MTMSPLQVVLQFGPGALAAIVTLAASPLLLPKLRLVRERDDARGYARLLEDRIKTLAAGGEGLGAIVQQVGALAKRIDELQRELVAARAEIAELRKVQIVATRFIASLIRHIRARGSAATMPEPPPEISDAVLAELRSNDELAAPA